MRLIVNGIEQELSSPPLASLLSVLRDVDPVDDALATAAYRREILPLLVRRALDELETA